MSFFCGVCVGLAQMAGFSFAERTVLAECSHCRREVQCWQAVSWREPEVRVPREVVENLRKKLAVLFSLVLFSCYCPSEPASECAIVHYDVRLGVGSDECRIVYDENGIDTCGPYAARHCALLWPGEFIDVADVYEVQTWTARLEDDGHCPLGCSP